MDCASAQLGEQSNMHQQQQNTSGPSQMVSQATSNPYYSHDYLPQRMYISEL